MASCFNITFGPIDTLPKVLQHIVSMQQCLDSLNKDNIDEVFTKIFNILPNLDNFDDLATNLCYFSQRNTRNTSLYTDLVIKFSSYGQKFIQSLYEAIRPCNGQFFRDLYHKKLFSREKVRAKINFDRRMHYFFLPEMNFPELVALTKNVSNIPFLKQFSKLLTLQVNDIVDICNYGYKRKSMEFVIKYDENKLLKVLIGKHPDKIHKLLEFEPYQFSNEKCTPIDFAAYYGSTKCFRLLLKSGEVITTKTCSFAVRGGSQAIINTCKSKGGDFSKSLICAIEMHQDSLYGWLLENTSLDDLMNLQFDYIISTGNYPVIWYFFMAGFDSSRLLNGNTVLHIAIQTRQFSFSKLIVSDTLMNNKKNAFGWTPLRIAIGMGYHNFAKMLVDEGVSINLNWNQTESLLSTALRFGSIEIANFLIKRGAILDPDILFDAQNDEKLAHSIIRIGVPIDFHKCKGNKPLHVATLNEDFLTMQSLIENGGDINIKNNLGYTAFHIAAAQANGILVAMLLGRECDINTRNILGETPLMCISRSSMFDIARIMIEMGTDLSFTTIGGINALHIASIFSRHDICALLIVHGCDKNAKDIDGKTPCDYATTPPVRILFN